MELFPADFVDLDLELLVDFVDSIKKENFELSEECHLVLLVRLIKLGASKTLQWTLLDGALQSRKVNLLTEIFKLHKNGALKPETENIRNILSLSDAESRAEIINLILDHKNDKDPSDFISFALNVGNLEFIDQIICAKAERVGLDPSKYSHLPVLQRIFELGPLVHEGIEGFTMLHAACRSDNFDLVKLFVENGLDIHANSSNGSTIHYACRGGNFEIFNYLVERKVSSSNHQITPLHCAVYYDHLNICKRIIELELCDINATFSERNLTALHTACALNHSEIAKLLLDAGADIDLEDSDGFTAVEYLSSKENIEILKHPRLFPKNWIEASARYPPKIVELFIVHLGLDLTAVDENGRNGLFYIAENLYLEDIADIIKSQGIDVNAAIDRDDLNPLYVACEGKDVKRVLQFQKVDFPDKNGRTAVHYAVMNFPDCHAYIESLDPELLNQCDKDGNNSLHLAALNGNHINVEELFYSGMDPSVKNHAGKTALDLAEEAGHDSIVSFIVSFINSRNK